MLAASLMGLLALSRPLSVIKSSNLPCMYTSCLTQSLQRHSSWHDLCRYTTCAQLPLWTIRFYFLQSFNLTISLESRPLHAGPLNVFLPRPVITSASSSGRPSHQM